jgi:gamma-glutamylaminecyclotransferase
LANAAESETPSALAMKTLLFVYGTLKRGCSNHHHLARQEFVGPARTPPGFRLYDLGGYPALAPLPGDPHGVVGEVWRVEADALQKLDTFEGVHEGLYKRVPVALLPPFAGQAVDAYVSVLPVTGRPDVGAEWKEPPVAG